MRIPGRMEKNEWVPDQDVPNVWDPSREKDPKNKRVSVVPLSDMAREAIASVPVIDVEGGKDFVFTTTGRGPLKGWSKYKQRLDRKMLAALQREAEQAGRDPAKVELKPWQHRDLRRTARTFMARMGVRDEVAEHCLAHALPTIQATYNRYAYLAEKRDAFGKLANLVERIINPPDNVVAMAPGRRKKGTR
jgi:Phage integrase family